MKKKVALFDFDGVIVNTEERNKEYLQETLYAFGIRLSEKDKYNLIGQNSKIIIPRILAESGKNISMEEFLLKRKEKGNTYENSDIYPMPGLLPLLSCLREEGWKMGIVSATSTKLIVIALNRMRMMNLFDVIVCGDMCEKSKPDPESYLKAMYFLNAEPDECIVFEDSTIGIRAAKLAKATVIAYRGSGILQDVHEADYVIDSYDEINSDKINSDVM